jgi:hypothetical protein
MALFVNKMKGLRYGKNAVSKAILVRVYFHALLINGVDSDKMWSALQ